MPLQTLSRVHAAHDINRGGHTVATYGCPGRIVDSHRSWADTTFTVEFAPRSKQTAEPASHWSDSPTVTSTLTPTAPPTTLVPERSAEDGARTARVLGQLRASAVSNSHRRNELSSR